TVAGERHKFGQGFYRFKVTAQSSREGEAPAEPGTRKEAGASTARQEPRPPDKRQPATQISVSKLEFLRSTNNNSWGVGFTEDGLVFGSTANNVPSVYLPIPNRYYEKVRGAAPRVLRNIASTSRFFPITERVRQVDFHGNFTAA